MQAGIARSEYTRKFPTQKDAVDHYNALAPNSFTEFRARSRHVTRYFIKNITIALHHFFEIDTALLLEYVLCENPEYIMGLSESIAGFLKLLARFEDVEFGLSCLTTNVTHESPPGTLAPDTDLGMQDTQQNVEDATTYSNNDQRYADYIKILRFLLNRFRCSFVDEINTVFVQNVFKNFNNENTVELVEEIFGRPHVLGSKVFSTVFRESRFVARMVEHENHENASRILEILLELCLDAEGPKEGGSAHLLNELAGHIDAMTKSFLAEHRYFINAMQFKNILALVRMKVRIRNLDVDLANLGYKTFLVVQLRIENYKNNLATVDIGWMLRMLDLSSKHTDNAQLHSNVYSLAHLVLKSKDPKQLNPICAYFISRMYAFFTECWAEEEGPKPRLNNLFPFMLDTYILLLELIAQWSAGFKSTGQWGETLTLFRAWETSEWNTLRSGFLHRCVRRETLKYANTQEVAEWLEDCISEPFLRYLCHVILEDLPDHDFFHEGEY